MIFKSSTLVCCNRERYLLAPRTSGLDFGANIIWQVFGYCPEATPFCVLHLCVDLQKMVASRNKQRRTELKSYYFQ